MTREPYTGWCCLNLLGHRQRVGIVSEVEMYGGKLLRIDVPCGEEFVTEYYGTAAVYSLEPISEEVGRQKHLTRDFRPVNPLSFREPTEQEILAHIEARARRISYDRDSDRYREEDGED